MGASVDLRENRRHFHESYTMHSIQSSVFCFIPFTPPQLMQLPPLNHCLVWVCTNGLNRLLSASVALRSKCFCSPRDLMQNKLGPGKIVLPL